MNTFTPEQIDEALCVTAQVQSGDMPAMLAFCRSGRRSAALYRLGSDRE